VVGDLMAGRLIEAAGGVLWRPAAGGVGLEIALVHRPKYDDWSLPKGKLSTDEHPIVGAVREVWEETGFTGVPGVPLPSVRYLKDGQPKRVKYWAMRPVAGEFVPNNEVDQLMWLPPREARSHLSPQRDRDVVLNLEPSQVMTRPFVLIRHGSAGERSTWQGDDRERPLDAAGEVQAEALVPLLSAYRVNRVLSADVLRCLQTVGRYAERAHLSVESEPLLSESAYLERPKLSVERVIEILSSGVSTTACSQGKTIPGLVSAVCASLGTEEPVTSVRKGGLVVLHVTDETPQQIAAVEHFDPPA
jgi:8-oxo-dGTP pyrophosphatase MutT (NUDIX family)/phosphohistidine phosphatase SixA